MNFYYSKYLILLAFILMQFHVFSQEKTKIDLIKAKTLEFDKKLGTNAKRLIGDVIFKHDSTYLYCDSAYLYEESNTIEAFSNVRIFVSDTLSIYSDLLHYDGNTKIAELHNNVRLVDNKATLTTDHLNYDRNTETASYYNGGKIVDEKNILTSKKGYYFTRRKQFFFRDHVVLINPDYNMRSDTLMYNTRTAIAYFFGPTDIESDANNIYCENGWYNTNSNISQFRKNAYLVREEQSITGDSLYYDRTLGLGIAIKNVIITDTVQNIISHGQYAEYREKEGYFFITDSVMAIIIEKDDSLFLHSDSLLVTFDSTQEARTLFAYNKVKFFRNDLQGKCDSLVYNLQDSLISLYFEPILWTKGNQLTADTIRLKIKDDVIKKMLLQNSAFVISLNKADMSSYDQLKGKSMTGYFKDGGLFKIIVNGNAETLYYIREDDGSTIGINKAESSNMLIYLDDNEISTITFLVQPTGTLYPEKDLPKGERKLKDFKWFAEERPKTKFDIFR